tara:strand:- start:2439 stop:3740 length:1302 start_codon:yes stop_codon:yes gene_type:complete
MANRDFDKAFTNPLLKKLDAEARKAVSRQRGQLLILADTEELQKVIQVSTGSVPSKGDLALALKEAQIHARRLQESFKSRNKRRYNAIVSKLPEIRLPYTLDKDMFIVSSFSRSITTIKNTMLKTLVRSGAIQESDRADISQNLHKGHGSRGNAVSQVQIATSVSALDDATKKLLVHNLEGAFKRGELGDDSFAYQQIKRLVTEGHNIVTKKGKLNANYVSVIAFQMGSGNIEDSAHEKAVKAVYRKFIGSLTEDMLDMKGSPSLKDKTAALVTDKFKGKKNVKVSAKSVKMSTKTKSKGKGSKTGGKVAISAMTLRTRKAKRRATDSAAARPLQMMVMINKELPQTIKANMDLPALQNRTGRFAESVKVVDAVQTRQGFPSFGYTYQKNPYQTFEPGFAQGSPERDPRALISRSIREIAVDLAIGRLYTRRL